MSDIRIVSTFNPANWDKFVKRNLLSWLEHTAWELVVYHEGAQPGLEHPRLVWRQWEDIPGASDFVEEARQFPPANGRFANGYDYNYDAAKFASKVYAQCDAAAEEGELLMWLDSDVEIVRPMLSGIVDDLMYGMPLARYERRGYHTETGIVIWDLRQDVTDQFFNGYHNLYKNRRVYCLPRGWHDCWALDFVVDQIRMPTADLGVGGDFRNPQASQLDVVSRSTLGQYMRHDKGMLKHDAA